MTDSAEKMREAIVYLRNLENQMMRDDIDMMLDDGTLPPSIIADRLEAALSASGTKSEIDEAGLERAVRECARITAPEITDAEYEAIRKGKDPRYLNTCAEMRRALIAYLGEAGEASIKPGPSDPIPSQPDEREAIARLLTAAKLLQQHAVGCATNHHGHDCELNGLPGWLADTKNNIDAAEDAILAMLAERRGAKP